MVRAAFAAIKGFYYQFLYATNLCVDMLNNNGGMRILCEGIEDIEKIESKGHTCIQVKTASTNISLSTKSFKKSILNFFIEYSKDKNIQFIFHTNAKIGTEWIEGSRKTTLKIWENNQKIGWAESDKLNHVLILLKQVLKDYAKQEGISGVDIDLMDEDFIRKVFLEFDNPESSAYEMVVKDKLKARYPRAEEKYLHLLFTSLVHLVIKKSISPNIDERYITQEDLNTLISLNTTLLESNSKDIIIQDEDGNKSSISELILSINTKLDTIKDNTDCILNEGLIPRVDMLDEKASTYEVYPFVTKLLDAKIPPKIVFQAKDLFYQAEYAIEKAAIFESEKKKNALERLKKGIKDAYTTQYALSKLENDHPLKLLTLLYKEIANAHGTYLASNILFDYFHKQGLLHHVSNEDAEVTWKI